jgi:hypothetical protein
MLLFTFLVLLLWNVQTEANKPNDLKFFEVSRDTKGTYMD